LGAAIKTVQGSNLTINAAGSGLVITDARGRKANITTANIQASNGVVHLIDKVILPPA
jgi:transforming growth factor-beta-induced protein